MKIDPVNVSIPIISSIVLLFNVIVVVVMISLTGHVSKGQFL